MDMDELQKEESFLHTRTRTELESDLERCLERKKHLEEEKNALYTKRIDAEAVLKQREEELSEVKVRLVSLQSEKERVERELEGFKQVKMGDQGRIDELNQRIAQLEREKAKVQEENSTLIRAIEQLEHDKEVYRAYSEEAEKLAEVKTEKLLADMRELQEANRQYSQQIQEGYKGVEMYEARIRQLMEEKAALENKIRLQAGAQESVGEFLCELKENVDGLQKLVSGFRVEGEKEGEKEREGERVRVEGGGEERKETVEELLGAPERIEPAPELPGYQMGEPGEEEGVRDVVCEAFPEELVETLTEPPEQSVPWEEEEEKQWEPEREEEKGERGEPGPEPVKWREEELAEKLEPEKREEKKRFPWEDDDESSNLGFQL